MGFIQMYARPWKKKTIPAQTWNIWIGVIKTCISLHPKKESYHFSHTHSIVGPKRKPAWWAFLIVKDFLPVLLRCPLWEKTVLQLSRQKKLSCSILNSISPTFCPLFLHLPGSFSKKRWQLLLRLKHRPGITRIF